MTKSLLAICMALFLFPPVALGAGGISLRVISIDDDGNGRRATVELLVPSNVSVCKDATLNVVVGVGRKDSRPDEFGPPRCFALKATSHEIARGAFRVAVALPPEKVAVRFVLLQNKQVLLDEKREI